MVSDGTLTELDQERSPGCYLHRSHPTDVARSEHLTFICSRSEPDAGPTNNWMSRADARGKIGPLFEGEMKGRTMYVVPYLMGPVGSPAAKVGVELTDSAYVVVNMRIMTRMGRPALDALGSSDDYCKGLHSLGDLNPDRRSVAHFPEERHATETRRHGDGDFFVLVVALSLGSKGQRTARFLGDEEDGSPLASTVAVPCLRETTAGSA